MDIQDIHAPAFTTAHILSTGSPKQSHTNQDPLRPDPLRPDPVWTYITNPLIADRFLTIAIHRDASRTNRQWRCAKFGKIGPKFKSTCLLIIGDMLGINPPGKAPFYNPSARLGHQSMHRGVKEPG